MYVFGIDLPLVELFVIFFAVMLILVIVLIIAIKRLFEKMDQILGKEKEIKKEISGKKPAKKIRVKKARKK